MSQYYNYIFQTSADYPTPGKMNLPGTLRPKVPAVVRTPWPPKTHSCPSCWSIARRQYFAKVTPGGPFPPKDTVCHSADQGDVVVQFRHPRCVLRWALEVAQVGFTQRPVARTDVLQRSCRSTKCTLLVYTCIDRKTSSNSSNKGSEFETRTEFHLVFHSNLKLTLVRIWQFGTLLSFQWNLVIWNSIKILWIAVLRKINIKLDIHPDHLQSVRNEGIFRYLLLKKKIAKLQIKRKLWLLFQLTYESGSHQK